MSKSHSLEPGFSGANVCGGCIAAESLDIADLREFPGDNRSNRRLTPGNLSGESGGHPADASAKLWQIRESFAVAINFTAGIRPQVPARELQECRFTGTVRAENRPVFAAPDGPIDRIENGFLISNVRDVPKLEGGRGLQTKTRSTGVMEYWSGEFGRIITPSLHYSEIQSLLLESREHLFCVSVKNLLLLFRIQPGDTFDLRPHVVIPLSGPRISFRTGAGPFGSEKTALRPHDFEQQFEGFFVVQCRVEIELAEPLIKYLCIVRAAQLRTPAADLVRNRTAAMRDNEFELGKILENF